MAVMHGREGNRVSGVALAMRHRLSGIPTYGLSGLGKENARRIRSTGVLRHLYLFTLGPMLTTLCIVRLFCLLHIVLTYYCTQVSK